jgi:hypothetical protein
MLLVKSYRLILQFSLEDKVSGGASTLFIFTAHGCSFFNTGNYFLQLKHYSQNHVVYDFVDTVKEPPDTLSSRENCNINMYDF